MNGHPAWREMGYSLDGIQLGHRARGGSRPVLLVHGIGPGTTGWLNFSCLIDLIRCGTGLHLIDLAGFGTSGRLLAAPYFNVGFWLQQLNKAVDAIIALHGQVPILVGNSAGGALVLKLAARRRDIRQVVAIGVPCGAPTQALRAFWTAPTDSRALAEACLPMTANRDLPSETIMHARMKPFREEGYAAYFDAMLADPSDCVAALQLEQAEAACIGAKVSLVHGREDRACPAASMLYDLLPKLPDADTLLLGGCGHNVCAERPASVARFIHALLEEATLT